MEWWERPDIVAARQVALGTHHQSIVVVGEIDAHRQHHLRDDIAVGTLHRHVVMVYHVEYDAVISPVVVVAVAHPVARPHMYLHIPHPHIAAYPDLGIEEIGTRTLVEQPRVDNLHAAPVNRAHRSRTQQPVLPHILHQLLHDCKSSKVNYQTYLLML